MSGPEKTVEEQIRNALRYAGIFHWKQWQGPMSQPKGVSDIIGILPNGRFFAIEVKREGWRPPHPTSKAYQHYAQQLDFIERVTKSNGIAGFVTSLENVETLFGFRLTPARQQSLFGGKYGRI